MADPWPKPLGPSYDGMEAFGAQDAALEGGQPVLFADKDFEGSKGHLLVKSGVRFPKDLPSTLS